MFLVKTELFHSGLPIQQPKRLFNPSKQLHKTKM